jgi:hypothetical protein
MTADGIFLTHERSPRIKAHFDRLVAETGSLVRWHFVFNPNSGAHPVAPFHYEEPSTVLAGRFEAMLRNGGVIGGYLDTLFMPLLRALPADHLWVMEYDVDYSGRWDELFGQFTDNDADLLTTTLMYRSEHPQWFNWQFAEAPPWVGEEQMVRALHPLMRLSRELVNTYPVAMADARWKGHYEFTLTTSALVSGARIEDIGGEGSFTPDERFSRNYIGRSATSETGHTFGFRPVRRRYFHEAPHAFARKGMLYHPVKPGVPAWSKDSRNLKPPPQLQERRAESH